MTLAEDRLPVKQDELTKAKQNRQETISLTQTQDNQSFDQEVSCGKEERNT